MFGWVFFKLWWFSSSGQVFSLILFIAECISLNSMSLGKSSCAGTLGDAANGQAQRL